MKREMTLTIDSDSANEAFAQTVVAAYVTRLDPTLEGQILKQQYRRR